MPDVSDLLDTNILVHAIGGGQVWQKIKEVRDPLMREPLASYLVVSEAEVRAFAEVHHWAGVKREQMSFILGYFEKLDINKPTIIEVYASIDAYSRNVGVRMGKNDLWIAATAHAMRRVLITTDRDFEHLNGTFLNRVLVDPLGA